ncbi:MULTISPECIES: hypothetical protein [unclassified Streptomyces]|uniref:hypothetical protein n=1 Tax=unclassified Streptomyces TaxID=2593676 RepID=UPI003369E11C
MAKARWRKISQSCCLRDYACHVRVLTPRPVPWPLVAIPGYGAAVGAVTSLAEALTG